MRETNLLEELDAIVALIGNVALRVEQSMATESYLARHAPGADRVESEAARLAIDLTATKQSLGHVRAALEGHPGSVLLERLAKTLERRQKYLSPRDPQQVARLLGERRPPAPVIQLFPQEPTESGDDS